MYINLTLKIKPNAKIQMNNMKIFFPGKFVFRYLFTANQDVLSHFFIPIFFLLSMKEISAKKKCVYIFIFCLRHFGIHEYSIMNRIYCFAPSIRVAPLLFIFLTSRNTILTYLPDKLQMKTDILKSGFWVSLSRNQFAKTEQIFLIFSIF